MVVISLILVALAGARGTLFIYNDKLSQPLRRWAVNKYGAESRISYLLHCPRCISVWVAAPAAAAWTFLTQPLHWWWVAAPAWLALSYVAILLLGLLETVEE